MSEQRRSRRFEVSLRLELTQGARTIQAESIDVSRHGILIHTEQALRERFLSRLVLHLPEGPLAVNAFVAGNRPALGAGGPAAALQFFAMSAGAKHRWDRYLVQLAGRPKDAPFAPEDSPLEVTGELPTFLVSVPSLLKLREIEQRIASGGTLYLVTPVVREIDSPLAVVLIHPETEREFTLLGRVQRVHPTRPRGIEIAFASLDDAEREALARFCRGEEREAPERSARTVDVVLRRSELPETARSSEESMSLDIQIDESALRPENRFSWGEPAEDMVVDLQLSDEVDLPEPSPPPADLGPQAGLRARCAECAAPGPALRFDPPEGALGSLAAYACFACGSCGWLWSLLRPRASGLRPALSAADGARTVPLAEVEALLAQSGFPRCPRCRRILSRARAEAELREQALALEPGTKLIRVLSEFRCSRCGGHSLELERP